MGVGPLGEVCVRSASGPPAAPARTGAGGCRLAPRVKTACIEVICREMPGGPVRFAWDAERRECKVDGGIKATSDEHGSRSAAPLDAMRATLALAQGRPA